MTAGDNRFAFSQISNSRPTRAKVNDLGVGFSIENQLNHVDRFFF